MRVKSYIAHHVADDKGICPKMFTELIEQWEFDYEVEKQYNPNALKI